MVLARKILANRLCQSGIAILLVVFSLALCAPTLSKIGLLSDPLKQHSDGLDHDGMPLPAGKHFVLGTDNLGRDVLSRVIYGTRVSLTVGVAAMLTATIIGVCVGLLSGFYGKRTDVLLMRFTEIMMTIPPLLLAVAFAGLMDGKVVHLHPSRLPWHFLDTTLRPGMVSIFLIIGFVSWTGIVRVVRGQVLALKEREFVLASRVLGASNLRLIFIHVLPNIFPTVIVMAAMSTAGTILLEAGLSYLGIGVPPPAPTWGSMISEGQQYFVAAPHIVVAPGIAIVLTVLGFNLFGQGLQDVIDPLRKSN